MKSKNEKVNDLETRIEQIIDRATDDWMNDPRINTSYHTHVAQAIVREFGLATETIPDVNARVNIDGEIKHGNKTRVIGKWEESIEQEPRP